jgi:hypothetical protein
MRTIKGWAALCALLVVSACGGGGGESGCSVFGSCDPSAPAPAADLTLVLDKASLENSGTDRVRATVTAVDANRNTLASVPVTISVDSNANVSVSGTTTDAQGVVTGDVSIGQDLTNRAITVTATSGAISRTATFQVTGTTLTSTALPSSPQVNSTNNQVQFRLTNRTEIPMVGQTVTVTAPGLPTSTGTTGASGEYTFIYTAPAAAGTLTITATAAGVTQMQDVLVQPAGGGGSTQPPATQLPQSASISTDKNVVSINSVGTNNRVEVRVLFLTASNAPIPNMRVRFDLDGDANSIGGSFTAATSAVVSDASGEAATAYLPGNRASPTDGVTIRACYSRTDFADCSTSEGQVRTRITVTGEALSVSIGTDNLIVKDNVRRTYTKDFVVMVVDAAGQAKADVQVTPSVDLPSYHKGYYVWNGRQWVQVRTLANDQAYAWDATTRSWGLTAAPNGPLPGGGTGPQPSCPQEDVNRNGSREAPAFTAPAPALNLREEDLNWNGALDARKADVAVTIVGSNRTDSRGSVIVRLEYPQDRATWVDFMLTASAGGISGSEGRATYAGTLYGLGALPPAAVDVSAENVTPPFVISPYGRGTVCTDTN